MLLTRNLHMFQDILEPKVENKKTEADLFPGWLPKAWLILGYILVGVQIILRSPFFFYAPGSIIFPNIIQNS